MTSGVATRFVLGVAGASGSGKTTLAAAIARRVGADVAVVIPHDAYYRPLSATERAAVAHHDFDAPGALDHTLLVAHLAALRRGATVQVPVYAFDVHDRVGATAVSPRPLVVVEGILLLAVPEVRDALDAAVFVDTPLDLCLRRRVVRDVAERGRTAPDVRRQWAETVAPAFTRWVAPSRAHAARVVDGSGDLEAEVDAVLDLLPPDLRGAR